MKIESNIKLNKLYVTPGRDVGRNSFSDLGRMKDWGGLAARGNCEIYWFNLHGEGYTSNLVFASYSVWVFHYITVFSFKKNLKLTYAERTNNQLNNSIWFYLFQLVTLFIFLIYYSNQVFLNFVHFSSISLLPALKILTIFHSFEYFINVTRTYKRWKKTFQQLK